MNSRFGKETSIIRYKGKLPSRGIVCGHPNRVRLLAREFLNCSEPVSSNRGFELYVGKYKNIPIFIFNTGIGAASAALAVEELAVRDVTRIIRLGTTDHNVKSDELKSLLIIEKAMGLVGLMIDYGFEEKQLGCSFSSSEDLLTTLLSTASTLGIQRCDVANLWHVEGYYAQVNPSRFSAIPETTISRIKHFEDAGIYACDMETTAIYMICEMRGIAAASVLQCIPKRSVSNKTKDEIDFEVTTSSAGKLVMESIIA